MEGYDGLHWGFKHWGLEVALLIRANAMGCDGRDPLVEACADDDDI